MGEQIPGRTEHTRRGRRLRALPEVDPASYPPDSVPLEYAPLPDPIRWRGRITAVADLAGDLLAAAVIAVMRRRRDDDSVPVLPMRAEPDPEIDALRLEPVRVVRSVRMVLDPEQGVGLSRGDDGEWKLSVTDPDSGDSMWHVAITPAQMQAVVGMVTDWDQAPVPGVATATYDPERDGGS